MLVKTNATELVLQFCSQLGCLTRMIYVLVGCLQKGQGAPAREPVVSSQEQKEMMAYYYRKQEELKVCLHMGDFTKKIRTTSLTKLMCRKFVMTVLL